VVGVVEESNVAPLFVSLFCHQSKHTEEIKSLELRIISQQAEVKVAERESRRIRHDCEQQIKQAEDKHSKERGKLCDLIEQLRLEVS